MGDEHEKEMRTRDPKLWDCGSSLYDSFELRSFGQQLDSTIINSSRSCQSMLRLSVSINDANSNPYLHVMVPAAAAKKKRSGRVVRSIHKLIRSVFRLKGSAHATKDQMEQVELDIYGRYLSNIGSSDGLTTIPEASHHHHHHHEKALQLIQSHLDELMMVESSCCP